MVTNFKIESFEHTLNIACGFLFKLVNTDICKDCGNNEQIKLLIEDLRCACYPLMRHLNKEYADKLNPHVYSSDAYQNDLKRKVKYANAICDFYETQENFRKHYDENIYMFIGMMHNIYSKHCAVLFDSNIMSKTVPMLAHIFTTPLMHKIDEKTYKWSIEMKLEALEAIAEVVDISSSVEQFLEKIKNAAKEK